MKKYHFSFMMLCYYCSFSQYNCNVFKYNGDAACYDACVIATQGAGQGTKESQLQFDKAIELCPAFDYAYFEKAVPYLKRGDFITWKKLIDKAVELNPTGHLGYRGWCRYQFIKDYKGAIEDIEKLESLIRSDIGYCINGDYHLNIAKALCYKALGQKNKAIEIMEDQLSKKEYSPMPYDYLHLGVLKMETNNLEDAIIIFKQSIQLNPYLADHYYYLGLAYKRKRLMNEYRTNLERAKTLYLNAQGRLDFYTHPMDKIFLSDIEKEFSEMSGRN
jgi:tetratricopeptide (TPR) repeat protein